jgi:hypothetical protein
VAGTGENVYQVPQLRRLSLVVSLPTRSTTTTRSNSRVVISRPIWRGCEILLSPCGIIHSLAVAFNESGRKPTERVRFARVQVSDQ